MTAPSCASVSSTLCALAAQCSAVTDAGTDLFVFVNPVTVGLPSIDECEQTFTQECDPGEVPAEGKLTLLSDPAGCAAALTASACEGGVLTLPSSCAACVPASGDAGDETVCAL